MTAPAAYEERIDLPSGQTLWYIDKHPTDSRQDHSYWRHNAETGRKGKRLRGVTTACKPLDFEREALMRYAARKQCEGVATLFQRLAHTDWLADAESIRRALHDHGLTYQQHRDERGEEGTNAHVLALQALAMGRAVPDFSRMGEKELQRALAISQFFLDHEPKASQVEQIVYSERLGVAGRLDFRGRLLARCDRSRCACQGADGLGVVDLKTGGFISTAAHTQVGGGYPLLADESGFGASEWAAILQVFDDGTYEFFPALGTPQGFEASLVTYKESCRVRDQVKQDRIARETAREMDRQIAKATEAVLG
jgi:hypothetical protein